MMQSYFEGVFYILKGRIYQLDFIAIMVYQINTTLYTGSSADVLG